MAKRLSGILLLLWAAACLAGCASSLDRQFYLDNSLRAYENALRWGEYEQAQALRRPGTAQPVPDQVKDIRITAYNVVSAGMAEDQQHWQQRVELRYIQADSSRELSAVHQQQWEYVPELKQWFIVSDWPRF